MFLRSGLLLLIGLCCKQFLFAQSATIKGTVFDLVSKDGLPGAYINIKGTSFRTAANSQGDFELGGISAGEYTVVIENVGYSPVERPVTLMAGQTVKVFIGMKLDTKTLTNITLFGRVNREDEAGARSTEKKANNVMNVISAQAIERSPDINAANVLQRMSGLTIQRNGGGDEAYPIVRGLDPSYNNTLINGIKIASPDEKSRYVPLNIVPSDLLGSIEVHKSLLPDMEGDAIGGTVNMVMKDAPDQETFKVLGSLGYSKIFLDRKFDGFSKADIRQKSPIEEHGASYVAQPGDFSRSNLIFKEETPLPNVVAGITYGNRFLDHKLGLLISENIQNQYYGSNSVFNQAAPDIHSGLPAISDYANRSFSTQQLNQGLVVHMDYDINHHNKIALTDFVLYSYLAQARTIVDTSIFGGNGGRTVPGTGPVSTDYTTATNRQFLENLKLEGKHLLFRNLVFDWAGVFSYAAKRTPDLADLALNKKIDTVHTTADANGPYTFVTTPNYFDAITRTWQHNEDKDFDGMANLSYKLKIREASAIELKAGGLYRHKERYNKQDQYVLQPTTNSNGVKQVFYTVDSAQWTVYNGAGTYDYDVNNYKVYENVTAAYGEAKISLPLLDIFGGVRMEKTEQGFTLNTFYATGINGIKKNYTDMLPSLMIKYKLNARTNLRFSYYKAISRPNYYDLVPATQLSASSATVTEGNPYLDHSTADNFDLRYEFFPREDEQLFAGVFYKKIQKPIEFLYVNGTTYQPTNAPNPATDYGAELAFTKYFGNIGVTGNYTYLYSRVSTAKSYYNLATGYINTDTLEKRSLQGQVDHTLNLSLLYKNVRKGIFAQVSAEYIGRSIAVVYPIYGYDYYQQPQTLLAFSAEKELKNRHFTLFTKFNNLLNTPTENHINNLSLTRDESKFDFSVGIRYSK